MMGYFLGFLIVVGVGSGGGGGVSDSGLLTPPHPQTDYDQMK